MGMPLAFSREADFTGISLRTRLKVSEVIHKAVIEVNEEGTKAAAATAVVINKVKSEPPRPLPPVAFRADHPFLFLIRDDTTGMILFMGRVVRP